MHITMVLNHTHTHTQAYSVENVNEPRNLERKKELLKDEASGKDKPEAADSALNNNSGCVREREREIQEGYLVIIARV